MTNELGRGYTPYYHAIAKHHRSGAGAWDRVLEVGIGTCIEGHPSSMVGYHLPGYSPGGSLRAWRDYLPNATVYGVDVAPDCMLEEERIVTKHADSRSSAQLEAALGDLTFDMVIDDGLHAHDAQISTLLNLFEKVKPGGYYVVEDVYPGSPFFDHLERLKLDVPWFTGPKKNIVVFSL